MLFNSFEFIAFWIAVALVFLTLLNGRPQAQKALLVAASLFFYAWWRFDYLFLLLTSIGVNFSIGQMLERRHHQEQSRTGLLALGVAANLLTIGYFKYFGLLVDTGNTLLGSTWTVSAIALPLAISFFTFQQIAYLVDASKGEAKAGSLLDYMVFVTFFPQLIAGPIVHHKEMMPQFAALGAVKGRIATNLAVGVTFFAMGLVKKTAGADKVAIYSDSLFNAVAAGATPTMQEAWFGTVAYSLQIYFDFSGYSDMAVGIARVFGIILHLNFFSPYQATSIIDFWRRWHITLSRFLRDYLYIPLGGGRVVRVRRYANLVITMVLGGLWHGAAWTFVVWGGLHGLYLVINHAWRWVKSRLGWRQEGGVIARCGAALLTFVAVSIAWVFFRAESFPQAWVVLTAMLDPAYLVLTIDAIPYVGSEVFAEADISRIPKSAHVEALALLLGIVWFLPNTNQVMRNFEPVLDPTSVTQGILPWYRRWGLALFEWRPDWLRAGFVLALITLPDNLLRA